MENYFKEKDFYIEPPNISDDATDKERLEVWKEWQKANAKERGKHKRRWTMSQKHGCPSYMDTYATIKVNGVWKQVSGPLALDGSNDSAHLILYVEPQQDRYFQARGKRGKLNRQKGKRAKRREKKRQKVLSMIK